RTVGQGVGSWAKWAAYLASSSFAPAWLLRYLPQWTDVLFPGVLATVFGVAGLFVARRERGGELALLYGGIAALACWISFGPNAGLYAALYKGIPLFAWLGAPSRIGILVTLALTVLGSVAFSAPLRPGGRPAAVLAAFLTVSCAELFVPLDIPEVPPLEPVYTKIKTLPQGPVIELPFFYLEYMFPRHTFYMLQSTAHWNPIVNGYSDYMPPEFLSSVMTLAPFPSRDSLRALAAHHVRYAIFHRYWYNDPNWDDVAARLREFDQYLRPLYDGENTRLYEIVGSPP